MALVAGAVLAWGGVSSSRPENVILVSIDTLSRASLRAFAPEAGALPHLDGFAQSARRFTNAYSTAPWTLPASASLMTGLYPDRHGATVRRLKLEDGIITLAQRFLQSGFLTAGFTDGKFVDESFGFASGFDRYDGKGATRRGRKLRLPRGGRPSDVSGASLFDRALVFLRQRSAEKPPFFLFVQTYVVHDYFRVHEWARSELSHLELRDSDYYSECLVGERRCSAEDWRALHTLYQLEVRRLDAGFGRLLGALEENGLRDSTLIVVLSDHGEGFGRDRFHHAGRLHEDQIRIPLMLSGPGVVPGVSSEPVSLVDVMPTLLDLLDLTPAEDVDGESFADALRDVTPSRSRALFAMDHAFWWEEGKRYESTDPSERPMSMAVIRNGEWYIEGPFAAELYDMAEDPKQARNLASASSSVSTLRALVAARRFPTRPLALSRVDRELQRQLASLGYVQRAQYSRSGPPPTR